MIETMCNASQIGLGTFPFSGVFSEVTQKQAANIFEKFLEFGGRYIETAPVYNFKDVSITNMLNSHQRGDYYIACKCVTDKDASGRVIRSGKYQYIIDQCKRELDRLRISHFDLFQTHIVPEDASIEETASALAYLQDQGLIIDIGVSNVSYSQLQAYKENCNVKYVQNRFSLVHQSAVNSVKSYCIEHGILFNPYQIIERGLLASQMTNNGKWRNGDIRNSKFEYNGEPFQVIRNWVELELLPLAQECGITLESLIIAWTLSQKQIGVAVVGITTPEQLYKIMEFRSTNITDEILSEIDIRHKKLSEWIRNKYNLSIEEFRGLN